MQLPIHLLFNPVPLPAIRNWLILLDFGYFELL